MTGTIDIDSGGVRWSLRPDLFERRAELLGADGLRLAEWVADGRASVLKQANHRSIYRVVLPGLEFHLKRYPSGGLSSWVRRLVRPGKARAEYERALRLTSLGIPAVEPLAVGEPRHGAGPGYLLTRTVPEARPLSDFFEKELPSLAPHRQTCLRQRLARALGGLLARMHDVGAVHDDLHPANILLRLVDDDEPLLCLVDLLAVRLGRPLDAAARLANLVIFNRWFALRSDRTDRLRFWRAYEAVSRGGDGPSPAVLEHETLTSNLRLWRQFDRRAVGHNRYFHRVRAGDVSGHAVADLPADAVAALLADPDEPFRRPGVVVLKHSKSSSVVELDWPGPEGPCRVIYKRFAMTQRSDPWAALFRPPPALRSFVMGHGLRLRGLPTPRPLAVLHRHRFGLPREGYLLLEKVPAARELPAFVAGLSARPAAEGRATLRRLIDRVARLIRTLHDRQLSQRDLKGANLLLSRSGWSLARSAKVWLAEGTTAPADEESVWFIDVVGVRQHRELPRARCVQNLVRLHASFLNHPAITRTDKLRFLRAYLGWGVHGKAGWKEWWRDIARATAAKIDRNRRLGRMLG